MKIKPRMLFAHMRAAQGYAEASYAQRLKVGCVIVDETTDQPIAIGWNGTEPGAPNVCEIEVEGKLVSQGVVHAEINAMLRTPYRETNGLVMFVTHSPCPGCTQQIIKSGIKKVVFREPYRITSGIVEMIKAGIEVYRVIDNHAVLRHFLVQDELRSELLCLNPDLR